MEPFKFTNNIYQDTRSDFERDPNIKVVGKFIHVPVQLIDAHVSGWELYEKHYWVEFVPGHITVHCMYGTKHPRLKRNVATVEELALLSALKPISNTNFEVAELGVRHFRASRVAHYGGIWLPKIG